MIVCPVPIWQLMDLNDEYSETPILELIVRFRLFEDPNTLAEFTLEEMIALYRYRDLSSLVDQYVLWYDLGAFQWIPEQRVHQEIIPSSEYLSETTIASGRIENEPNYDKWRPVKHWGERRTPKESWEES